MNLVIGLTGGIGSGKSTVADLFAECGVSVVDTDIIAHELTAHQGAAMPAIEAAFGTSVIGADGSLDRTAMRRLAFSDPHAKKILEAILHPMIRSESSMRCRRPGQTHTPYTLLVVPLLIESGSYRDQVNRVLVVDCYEEIQIARVMARSGLSSTEVRDIMATQLSRTKRLAAADDIVTNNNGLEELPSQIGVLHQRYLALAKQAPDENKANANC